MDEKQVDELIAQERRAYHKEWRAKNKDKLRKYNRNFFMKRAAAKLSEQHKDHNDDNED